MRTQTDKGRKPRAQAPTPQTAQARAQRTAAALVKLLAALAPRNDNGPKNR
jgi:hypothetical protein